MSELFSLGIGTLVGSVITGLIIYGIWLHRYQKLKETHVRQATQLENAQNHLQEKQQVQEQLQARLFELSGKHKQLEHEVALLREARASQESEREALHQQMRLEFGQLAQQILDQKSQHLGQQHQQQLQHLLNPFKDRMQSFEQKIEQTYTGEMRERVRLQQELKQLFQLNQQLSQDAQNLTQALKGDNKVQGNWGELVLSRILEASGLREGEEFVVQGRSLALNNAQGKRIQPDVIIQLPDDKHIIIDAKVSLRAYEQLIATRENGDHPRLLQQHLDSVRQHIRSLNSKHYDSAGQLNSPDFVMLFMPIEPAFTLALQHGPDLFQLAWDQKIVLVSPYTLTATLKTVASLWRIERQNQNALEIARQGGLLYDRLAAFVEELEKLGRHVERADESYHEAMRKLRDGQGNLISRAKRLEELGVKTQRHL